MPIYPCPPVLWEALLALSACPLCLLLVPCLLLVAFAPGFPREGGEDLGLVPQLMSLDDVAPVEPCCFMPAGNLALGAC